MIEIPESQTLAGQLTGVLENRTITAVFNATHPHKFTWYAGDPSLYSALLVGRRFLSAEGYGAFVDLRFDDKVHITVGDGTNLRFCGSEADVPTKYQLLLTFDDDSFLVFTVAMYGAIYAYRGELDNLYVIGARSKPSPLGDIFDAEYFQNLWNGAKQNLSAKAFLATEQRIPGLGNGVLQDILFSAGIHPKRKLATLSHMDRESLYHVLKGTLREMTELGGRDTERDIFGNSGGYRTLLSRNTCHAPCPVCGRNIVKEPYLGGAVYYCASCQPFK